MNKEFTFHKLNQEGIDKAIKIAEAFDLCLETLTAIMPLHTREMAICRTKLEEACFFAKKSMANSEVNQA